MTDRFSNLKAACGGVLNPETLTRFQIAMREYDVFMAGMRELLAPIDKHYKCRHRDDGRGRCIDCGDFI